MKSANLDNHILVERSLRKVALISIVLFGVKLFAFVVSGSLLALGSAFDSLSDAILSFVNGRLHRVSHHDADREHPFGHGGIEVVASLIQGVVIFSFGVSIVVESFLRIYRGGHDSEIRPDGLLPAFIVMVGSAIGAYVIHLYLSSKRRKVEENRSRSLVLMADHAHYSGDAFANAVSALGIAVVWFSHLFILDAVFGVVSGAALCWVAVPVLKQSISDILHTEIAPDIQQKIVDIAYHSDKRIISIHRLRSRALGPMIFIDFHLKLPRDLTIEVGHDIGDHVSAEIKKHFPQIDIIIHIDPDSEPDDELWEPSFQPPEAGGLVD